MTQFHGLQCEKCGRREVSEPGAAPGHRKMIRVIIETNLLTSENDICVVCTPEVTVQELIDLTAKKMGIAEDGNRAPCTCPVSGGRGNRMGVKGEHRTTVGPHHYTDCCWHVSS